jgi:sensor domain CHASE-containing protein
MLIWLLIFFAVVVYGLGHATRAWLRSNRETRDTDASAGILESGLLTDEERQKMRERLKEKLRQ